MSSLLFKKSFGPQRIYLVVCSLVLHLFMYGKERKLVKDNRMKVTKGWNGKKENISIKRKEG